MTDPEILMPLAVVLSLAIATLVSEDLTCIAAGLLVAERHLSFAVALGGCLAGIVGGDVLLMLVGRQLGGRAMESTWLRRLVPPAQLMAASAWMQRRGGTVVFASRFLPGTRLATYLAAGMLGVNVRRFACYAVAGAVIWVPLLIALAAAGGRVAASQLTVAAATGAQVAVGVSIGAFVLRSRLPGRRSLWRLRRRAFGFWRRWTRWEFWPMWLFYPPVIAYIAWLAIRHRGATVFTAANPAIPAGGVVGESKFEILRRLSGSGAVARTALIAAGPSVTARTSMALAFLERHDLEFPVVLKPDQGQRGAGVTIVQSRAELRRVVATTAADLLIQEYIPGVEFGVFYYRRPGDERGRILSITAKHFPAVVGDGVSTLDDLILADARAVCLAPVYRRRLGTRVDEVPAEGERVTLVDIGSHCRGSVFLDASHLATPALTEAVDGIASGCDGFYFGRFDVRADSTAAFSAGSFRILELNGVTSEATHIYDPATPLADAYRVLCEQWRLAFEIGAANHRRGAVITPAGQILRLALRYHRGSRLDPARVNP